MCMHVSIINFQNFILVRNINLYFSLKNTIVSIFNFNRLITCLERKINNLYAPRSIFVTFNLPPLPCQITKTIRKQTQEMERKRREQV